MGEMKDITKNEKWAIKPLSSSDYRALFRAQFILDWIKENPYITPYKISKDTGIDYSTVSRVVSGLEFVKLIAVKTVVAENNRANKLLFVPEIDFDVQTATYSAVENAKELKGGKL